MALELNKLIQRAGQRSGTESETERKLQERITELTTELSKALKTIDALNASIHDRVEASTQESRTAGQDSASMQDLQHELENAEDKLAKANERIAEQDELISAYNDVFEAQDVFIDAFENELRGPKTKEEMLQALESTKKK